MNPFQENTAMAETQINPENATHAPTSFDLAEFYEEVGQKVPEAELVYATLGGHIRKGFIISALRGLRGTLLDIGCNVGTYCKEYRNGIAFGVDISPSLVAKAKMTVPGSLFFVGDAQSLGVKDGSFDMCSSQRFWSIFQNRCRFL
jgi:SAM-dependent methyltransferase